MKFLKTLALIIGLSIGASAQIPASLGWYEVPNTKIGPPPNPDGLCPAGRYPSCRAVVSAWGGGIFDTLRNRMVIWGGGHGDYTGNELYATTFSGTPSSARLTNPTAGGCSLPSCDGGVTPNARHTYHVIDYMANIDSLFSWSGSTSGAGFGFAGAWLYHFDTQQWQYLTQLQAGGTTNPLGTIHDFTAYDPVTGRVYVWDSTSLAYWDPAAGLGSNWVMHDYHTSGYAGTDNGVIDPVRRRLYIVSGNNQGLVYLNLNTAIGADSRVNPPDPTGDTAWLSGYAAMAFDPTTNNIVIWTGGNDVYVFNPTANTSTKVTGYTGGPGAGQDHGTYGRWSYSPALGVFTLINSIDQNAYTFRLNSSTPDVEVPTAPSMASATTVSSSQINLSWTASTDNIAVAHYLIEQCSGSGCSNFSQIASTTSTSYSVMSLTASTLYRYRIRADDAAGNTSSYSSTVEDTTSAGDVTAPTAPSMLSATTQSFTQINLTWTASTDAVGVTGYRVERCAGASCVNFIQVAAPASNAYNDTGLTQNTSYSYRVRATDAAGNLSNYSSTATDTTDASTIRITGTGQTYATITAAVAAAVDGDTIEVDAGIYPNESFTVTQCNLTLRGVGGLAHLKWDTGDYQTSTTDIPNGQGIIKWFGCGTGHIEYIEFSGAAVADENGAGVRYGGSGSLTITHSYFHDNQEGILGQGTDNDTLTIEYSRFENNGQCISGDCAHNVYIGYMGQLIFQYNKSTDPLDGHALKSRARINKILYNHLSTKGSNGSFEAEFPNGHLVYFIGNVIEQGDDSDNSTMLRYGSEGLTSPTVDVTHELYIVNNSFYNWRTNGVTYIQISGTPTLCTIVNNAYDANGGTFRSGGCTTVTESHNAMLEDNEWSNINASDFRILTGSVAKDAGISPGTGSDGFGLTPLYSYAATSDRSLRVTVGSAIDEGAYEFGTPTAPPSGDGPGSVMRLRK